MTEDPAGPQGPDAESTAHVVEQLAGELADDPTVTDETEHLVKQTKNELAKQAKPLGVDTDRLSTKHELATEIATAQATGRPPLAQIAADLAASSDAVEITVQDGQIIDEQPVTGQEA